MEDKSSPASMMLPQDDKKRSGNACLSFSCWLFQLTTWGLLGYLIVCLISKSHFNEVGIGFGISYVIYIILEFCSPTCSYLINKQIDQGMYEKMGKLFSTPPVINFYAECYHYETHTYTTRDSEGKTQTHTETRKVVTHTDSYNMPYSGTNSIDTCSKVIYDHGGPNGNYSNGVNSILTINPERPGKIVSIKGSVVTERGFDFLYIYDGI